MILKYLQNEIFYTFFRMVNTFDEPSHSSKSSYIYTGMCHPGNHSVIVYLPEKDEFYCKNISIDDKRFSLLGLKDISKCGSCKKNLVAPIVCFKKPLDDKVDHIQLSNFLSDMHTATTTDVNPDTVKQSMQYIYDNYLKINQTFYQMCVK